VTLLRFFTWVMGADLSGLPVVHFDGGVKN